MRRDTKDVEKGLIHASHQARNEQVVRALGAQCKPLYAILDAARDPLILARTFDCTEEHQSLYEGVKGDELVAVAPYLLALPTGSSTLDTLVQEGWGKSWGVYLTSNEPFKEIRKHLRHFLMVELEGKQVYFRYYDPRVLRPFLPSCSRQESARFFGPISAFLMESDDPDTIVRFETVEGELEKQEIRVDAIPDASVAPR